MFCRRTPGSSTGTPKDNNVVITALPLYHIFSLTANCLVFTQTGARNISDYQPSRLSRVRRRAESTGSLHISGVNTLFNALLNTPGFDQVDFSSLRVTPRRRHGGAEGGCRTLEESHRARTDAGLGPDRDIASGLHQSAFDSRNSTARSGCQFPPPRCRYAMMTGVSSRSTQSAKSASAGHR